MSTVTAKTEKKKGLVDKFLYTIETVGNKLPHPATLFGILALAIIVLSAIGSMLGWQVEFYGYNRQTKEMEDMVISVTNLLSIEGIRYIFTSMVTNFTGFAPLGTVLAAILGIGVCERSGLMGTALKRAAISTPKSLVTVMVVFLGVMSNVASDAGYVVLPPLAALIFISFGRHPLAGLAAAFAGVSGGFSANLLIGTIDPLLGGISTEAAKLIDPAYEVGATANYFFMFVSTFLIAALGTFVVNKIVEPRLGEYKGETSNTDFKNVTAEEKAGMLAAKKGLIIVGVVSVALWFILGSKIFLGKGLVPIMILAFAIPGIFYGRAAGTIKSDHDVMGMLSKSMAAMGGYIVLVFFAAQFVKYFSYTNLGTILAVKGAAFLKATGLTGIPLIILFVVITGFINLFMGSASAKWAILAPVFIPMFMQIGFTPEFTQLAYRIGDSTTNIISPLMSYFAMIIVYMQMYDKKSGLGTLVSLMLPFSMVFLVGWSILLIIWMTLGLPIGPGVGMML